MSLCEDISIKILLTDTRFELSVSCYFIAASHQTMNTPH